MLAGCRLPDRREKCACPPGFAGGRAVRAVNAYRRGSSIRATHLLYGRTTLAPRRACQTGAPLDRASAVERGHAPATCAPALHLISIFSRAARDLTSFFRPRKSAPENLSQPSCAPGTSVAPRAQIWKTRAKNIRNSRRPTPELKTNWGRWDSNPRPILAEPMIRVLVPSFARSPAL